MKIVDLLKKNKNRHYFYTYCFGFLGYGGMISSLGGIIPFMSKRHNLPETEFASLFMWSSIGNIVGNFLAKKVDKHFSYHKILAFSSFGYGFFTILFSVSHSVEFSILWRVLSNLLCGIFEVYLPLCVFETHKRFE